jgi:hypothetical protein
MTVSDVINASLRKIGILASGEVPTANEQTDAFTALTNMLDSMSNERLVIYSILREAFNLIAGQQTYTFGTGGNFNSARPQKIENAYVQAYGTNPVAELKMKIVNKDEYADLVVKTVTSSIPIYLYNDNSNPLANINVWPVPSVNTPLILYSWKALSSFAAINTTITLPPGYLRMIIFNLAVELASDYGLSAPDQVVAIALSSMKNIKRMNSQPLYLSTDAALGSAKGAFNWLTGDTE